MKHRIKILFMTGFLGVGGKERQMVELIKRLPSEKFEKHLFIKSSDGYFDDELKASLDSRISLEKESFSLNDVFRVKNVINEIKPDIVHCWSITTAFFSLFSRYFFAHPFRLVNGSIRDAFERQTLPEKINSKLYSLFNTVVANSEAGLKAHGQFGKPGRYVIHNGFDMERIPDISREEARRELGFDMDAFTVSMVGGISVYKDHDAFIRAAAQCLEKEPEMRFYIAGDGALRKEREALVKYLGLEKQVIFLGQRRDVEKIFIASDLSVLMSTNGEGISNSIMESFACGTPVIASSCGGTMEIVEDGVNGFVVPAGDSKMLAERIIRLKKDGISENMRSAALNTIKKKFRIDRMIADYIRLYSSLVGEDI